MNNEKLEGYKSYLLARSQSINYYNIIRIWLKYLDKNKIETITQEVVTNFFIDNPKYKDNSKCMFIKAGRSYYSEFLQIPKEQNEWYKIKLIKVERNIPYYLTEKDIEEIKRQLVTFFSKKMTPIKLRTLIDFLYYSGIRKKELLTLKRQDIDLENKTAKVLGKGKKERIICFPEKVKKELIEYFASENEEFNCFNIKLGKLHYLIKKIKKLTGKNIYCHLFRHGFARNLLYNKGVDLNTVSKLLGHSSLNTTMIYINPDEKTITDNYHRLVG